MAQGLNEQAEAFRNRPPSSTACPVLWVDALYEKVRYSGRVMSMAILVVCGANREGKREVLAIDPCRRNPGKTPNSCLKS
jgi:putative transposase